MNAMSVDLIIFDCDGVLIDSEVLACRTDAACLAEIGITISADEIMERYVGISAPTMLADIKSRSGTRLSVDFAANLQQRIAEAFETELTAIPGIEQVLSGITVKVCVASSSAPERLRHSLSIVGLLDHFLPNIFSASQVAHGKPAPDLFLFSARQMRTEPHQCLVIEDSVAGVKAAIAAGMRVLGFTGGGHCRAGHAQSLLTAGAQKTFQSMSELPNLL